MDWLYEFDEEAYKEMLYNDGYEAGKKLGMEELIGNAIKSGKTRKEISEFLNIPIEEIS